MKQYLAVLELLQTARRPMTAGEIAGALRACPHAVSKSLWRLRKMGLSHIPDRKPVRVGFCTRHIALHAAGAGPIVPEPPGLSQRDVMRRWRAARKLRVASVFDLGHLALPSEPSPKR